VITSPSIEGAGLFRGPCVTCTRFERKIDMPIAEISGASRNEPRSGRYASRSIAQAHSEVRSIPRISTMRSATASEPSPNTCVSASRKMRAMKVESMNTSPWAKLTMPMMPNTIV
jgi:hypothetical protein